jgi:ATP synthase protein I
LLLSHFVERDGIGKDGMTEDELWQDPKSPQGARLASLDERLAKAQAEEAARTGIVQPDANYRLGMRVLGELIGAPFGGAVIGLVLDRWLGTKPWLLLALLFLGLAVGIRNVIRISKTPMGPGPGAS